MYSIAYSYNRLGKYTHGGTKDVKRRSNVRRPLPSGFTCSLKIRTKDLVMHGSTKRPAERSNTKWVPLTKVKNRENDIKMKGEHKAASETEEENLPSIFEVEKENEKLLKEASKYLFLEKSTLEYSTRGLEKRLSASNRRLDAEELVDLVWRCGGDLRQAANVCGAKRGQVKRWLTMDGNLEVLEEIDEAWNDVAENVVNKKLLDGNLNAAQFRLETKAKDRGYVRKSEVDVSQVIQVVLEGDAPEVLNIEHKEIETE